MIKKLNEINDKEKKLQIEIIAGQPGSYKTNLAIYLSLKNHKKDNKILFVSLDMSLIKIKQLIDKYKNTQIETIKNKNFIIDNNFYLTDKLPSLDELEMFDIIIIDYVQLIKTLNKF